MRVVLNVDQYYDAFTPEQTAQLVKTAGFDAVDYGLFKMVDPEDSMNGKDSVNIAEGLKDIYLSAGVPIVQTHAPFSFKQLNDPEFMRQWYYPTIVRSVEVSAAMGARYVIVHPLHHLMRHSHGKELLELNMQLYRSLIPVCRANGIKVAIENMFQRDRIRGGHIVDSVCSRPEELCAYVDALDSEYMVACLDIGHTTLVYDNTEPWDFIRILGHDRLKTLHVHDNDYLDDRHVIPFSGKIDWYKVTEALGQINYSGDMVLECLMGRVVSKLDPQMYPVVLEYMARIGHYLTDLVENNRVL